MSYQSPEIRASGCTFAQLQALNLGGVLAELLAANVTETDPPSAAVTVSASGGGGSGGAMAPGNYYACITEDNGFGETPVGTSEAGPFAVARQANPTVQATADPTGGGATGGSLAAGTYFVAYTWVDSAGGETTVGTSESAQFTVGATNIPRVTIAAKPSWASGANIYLTAANGLTTTEKLYRSGVTTTTTDLNLVHPVGVVPPAANTTTTNIPRVTFPALKTGNVARNVYVTAPAGSTGTEKLYSTQVTAAYKDLATAVNVSAAAPPTENTTEMTAYQQGVIDALKGTDMYHELEGIVRSFLSGAPVGTTEILQDLTDMAVVAATLKALIDELATLIDANPGTLSVRTALNGSAQYYRAFP